MSQEKYLKYHKFWMILLGQTILGKKTGSGFYKKNKDRTIHSVNLKTGEYSPQNQCSLNVMKVLKRKRTQ